MKRIYLVFIVLIGVSVSCTKNFEDMNTDQRHPVEVPGDFLFANAQKALADQMASTNVNLNIWKLVAQYWTETTYTDETNYDIITRNIPDLHYRTYYRDILSDFKDARRVIATELVVGEEAVKAQQNRYHIITLLECFAYQELVDMFGNIPYSEAVDIEIINPAYDDAATIYNDLLVRAKEATDGLDAGFGSFGANDLYLGGDVAMWKKFGNSLLIKLAINLSDVNSGLAQSTIEAAYAGAFAVGEVCQMSYPGGANSNPLYVDLVQSGRHDFVPSNTMVDMMNALNDPRMNDYFTLYDPSTPDDPSDDYYIGGIYGESNNWSSFSHIAPAIEEPTFPMVMMDGTEVAFYLAEAAAKGYSVGGDAKTWYDNAVTSSILHWNGTATEASDYLAQTEIAFPETGNEEEQLEAIGTQAWLAYYIRGFHGWTSYRRLDAPTLGLPPAPETPDGQIPKRFSYPVNEQTLNAANYDAAVQAMGGADNMSVRIFWDIN
jgi:hypothetical protein